MIPARQYVGTCAATGKRQYVSRKIAKVVARSHPGNVRPYRCLVCDFIHLGSKGGYDREWHRNAALNKYGEKP